MKCENCHTRKAEYLCHRVGKKPRLCSVCLHESRSLFCAWQRLEDSPILRLKDYTVCISIPAHVRQKWVHQIVIDSTGIRLGKQSLVSRAGRKGCARFFALEKKLNKAKDSA